VKTSPGNRKPPTAKPYSDPEARIVGKAIDPRRARAGSATSKAACGSTPVARAGRAPVADCLGLDGRWQIAIFWKAIAEAGGDQGAECNRDDASLPNDTDTQRRLRENPSIRLGNPRMDGRRGVVKH
jgi:hypothetical protein